MKDEYVTRITVSLYQVHLQTIQEVEQRFNMNTSAALRYILDDYNQIKRQMPLPFIKEEKQA